MGAGSKRTAAEAGLPRPNLRGGETLDDTKTSTGRGLPWIYDSDSGSMDSHDGAWSVAESKSARKKKRKVERNSEAGSSINFLRARPERVDLKALQDLVLYVLADGVAPTWLAVNNAKQIKKVVVLMVPGLDQDMLENPELWTSISEESETENLDAGEKFSFQANFAAQDLCQASVDASTINSPSETDTYTQAKEPPTTRDHLLEHILQVRAPGDSRMNRVHSPLQNMLIAPFSESSKQKGNNGKDEKSFQAIRTTIATFVLTADELRDAEYPIHPAAFTNPRDASLEQERREKTGQSTSSGWVDTDVKVSNPQILPSSSSPKARDPLTQGLRPYAIDCEMVLTSDDKYSLARISLVDWSGKTMVDKYVKPSLPIKNYFTEFSGITEEILKGVTTTLEDIQKELLGIFGQDTILLGHSLESDFNALKLTHPFVIDTSIIYPHPRGLPLRSSLKFLANRYLKREIQKGGLKGHDSVEDARAVLDLVKLKCEKGPRWGTLDANGESIFRRIGGTLKMNEGKEEVMLKMSAIVEYGTPERGLGKDATYHIACESDDQIVQGILRAARGDPDGDLNAKEEGDGNDQGARHPGEGKYGDTQPRDQTIPPGGVDFIWSRLRDLEAIRRWNTLPSDSFTTTPSASTTAISPPPTEQYQADDQLKTVMREILRRILQIYTSLPPRTLFIIYSGTGDMRPLLRLQNLHAQYKREFKVKKWDELSVKWTDTEEQEMRKECEKARRGVGVLVVR